MNNLILPQNQEFYHNEKEIILIIIKENTQPHYELNYIKAVSMIIEESLS